MGANKTSVQVERHSTNQTANTRKVSKKDGHKSNKDHHGANEKQQTSKTASQINRINPHAINANSIQFLNQQKITSGDQTRGMREV